MAHFAGLILPIRGAILDNTQGVNPQVSNIEVRAESSGGNDGVLECLRKLVEWDLFFELVNIGAGQSYG
jgi:hypothetical protein